jgi:hypothetical protein
MALIPPFFLDTVVALGTVNEQGQTNWVGTGFLYGKFISKEGENKLYQVYLVTNKHVMNNLKTIVFSKVVFHHSLFILILYVELACKNKFVQLTSSFQMLVFILFVTY